MDTYREWGSATVMDGDDAQYVLSPDFYFVENNDEFFASREALLSGIGAMAVNPATGKMYYKSYTGEWLPWGSESGSGSDTPSEVALIPAVLEDRTLTIQAPWSVINEKFNSGATIKIKLSDTDEVIGTVLNVDVYSDGENPDVYLVDVERDSGKMLELSTMNPDDYPSGLWRDDSEPVE